MIEVSGDMFEEYLDPSIWYVITTNGYVKNNGEAVMGAGTAKIAAQLHGDLPNILGDLILAHGNVPFILPYNFISLPVKHHWKEKADLPLINHSLATLRELYHLYGEDKTIYLPRPGCGNGGLSWYHVQTYVEMKLVQIKDKVIVWSLEDE